MVDEKVVSTVSCVVVLSAISKVGEKERYEDA